jgi:hypothetical protein
MVKRILLWSSYVGFVGLIIFGAVLRTEAKTEGTDSLIDGRFEQKSSDRPVQGGGNWDNWEADESVNSGEPRGRTDDRSAGADEIHLAETEEHDWIHLAGTVSSINTESLWVFTDQGDSLEITGRAWRYILEQGVDLMTGDQVVLEGFYEDGEYEVAIIKIPSSGVLLQVREETGRPMWSGGSGR